MVGIMNKAGKLCGVFALAVLFSSALAVGGAFATEGESAQAVASPEKSETVHVYTLPDGTVKKVEVTAKLSNPDKVSQLMDVTNLLDIEADGDEASYSASGENLTWSSEGKDVEYTGTTSNELPIQVNVTYTLDGAQVTPEQIAGATGHVTIRYDFVNKSTTTATVNGVQQQIYTPFVTLTGVLLDADVFSNVKVTSGRVMEDDGRYIVIGYAMPGLQESLDLSTDDVDLPGYFEIESDAKDFELKSALTMISPNMLDGIDPDDFDISELTDASNGLQEGIDALVEGSNALADGLKELADGSATLSDGASQVKEGAEALDNSTPELASGIHDLHTGSSALASNVSQLPGAAYGLANGAAGIRKGLIELKKGLNQAKSGVDTFAEQLEKDGTLEKIATALTAAAKEIGADAQQLVATKTAAATAAGAAEQAATAADGAAQAAKDANAATASAATDAATAATNAGTAATAAGNAASAAASSASDIDTALAAVQSIPETEENKTARSQAIQALQSAKSSAATAQSSAGEVQSAASQVQSAANQVQSDVTGSQAKFAEAQAQAEGAKTAVTAVQENAAELGNAGDSISLDATTAALEGLKNANLGDMPAKLKELSEGLGKSVDALGSDKEQESLIGGANAVKDGANSLGAGLDAVKDGVVQLDGGLAQLDKNTTQLTEGVKQLASAVAQLSEGTSKLTEGAKSAADGSGELAKGLATYSNEGIAEVVKLVNTDLSGLHDRMEALTNAGSAYTNFSGIAEGTAGEVKFIVETDAIKAQD